MKRVEKPESKPKQTIFVGKTLDQDGLEITLVRGENRGDSISYLWFGSDNKHLATPTTNGLRKLRKMIDECLASDELAKKYPNPVAKTKNKK